MKRIGLQGSFLRIGMSQKSGPPLCASDKGVLMTPTPPAIPRSFGLAEAISAGIVVCGQSWSPSPGLAAWQRYPVSVSWSLNA